MSKNKYIEKYFSNHPDKKINTYFRDKASFFLSRNCITDCFYVKKDALKIQFSDKLEFRNKPIVEDGKTVGHVRLAEAYQTINRKGSFLCKGVKKLKHKKVVKKWRKKDVKIRRSFLPWSSDIVLKINNNHLHVLIKCREIIPDSLSINEIINESIPESFSSHEISTGIEETDDKNSELNAAENSREKEEIEPINISYSSDVEEKTDEISDQTANISDKVEEPQTVYAPPSKQPELTKPTGEKKADITSGKLYVNYIPTNPFKNVDPWKYPVVKLPKKDSIIRTPRSGKIELRGYKEAIFQNVLTDIFDDLIISGEHRIATGNSTRPYEPDISIITDNFEQNVFIDIEIDEPYAGISRKALHLIGEDDIRDIYFNDRGWIVIRFTEKQIHEQEFSCLKFIAEVIKAQIPEFAIPSSIDAYDIPKQEPQWDLLQAQKWARENYRENYLNHKFGPIDIPEDDQDTSLTQDEANQELEVISTPIITHVDSTNNLSVEHERDKRIQFDPDEHIYLVDGIKATSVTELVECFFPTFNTPYWAERKAPEYGISPDELIEQWRIKGETAANKGSLLHEQIEKHFQNGESFSTQEFQMFLDFMDQHGNHINPFRTEWRVFDENYMIAGTADLLSKNIDGSFDLYDWKRSKKVVYSDGQLQLTNYNYGFGPLSNLSDNTYNKYVVQQNLYQYILEKHYGIKISNRYLVVIHPNYEAFFRLEISEKPDLVNEVLSAYKYRI